MQEKTHAVAVFIITPSGIPLVRDPRKPEPVYWKLPGGKQIINESPLETAAVKVWEKCGLNINPGDLVRVKTQDKGSHDLYFFRVDLKNLRGLKQWGEDGEEVQVFPAKDVFDMQLLPSHGEVVEEVLARTL